MLKNTLSLEAVVTATTPYNYIPVAPVHDAALEDAQSLHSFPISLLLQSGSCDACHQLSRSTWCFLCGRGDWKLWRLLWRRRQQLLCRMRFLLARRRPILQGKLWNRRFGELLEESAATAGGGSDCLWNLVDDWPRGVHCVHLRTGNSSKQSWRIRGRREMKAASHAIY